MSDTKIDMPKVTQMLDAGWVVQIEKCSLGSYAARGKHPQPHIVERARQLLESQISDEFIEEFGISRRDAVTDIHFDDGALFTDDFTPEQALTRLAYKVHGEIL